MKGGERTPAHRDSRPAAAGLGTLYVVATPIGNLEDITLRALRVLGEVALVAAEDTRRTANLLHHYQIRTPLLSLHTHNERRRADEVLRVLSEGRSIALVSDAGTPAIADPGAFIVSKARAAGVRVEPIPGPSAVTAALSASGLGEHGHTFVGFPPVSPSARRHWFSALPVTAGRTMVVFEAPHRIRRTLIDFAQLLGERPIWVVRELTKLHEEWTSGPARELATALPDRPRGEFVILIPPALEHLPSSTDQSDTSVECVFGQLTELDGLGRREAIRETARRLSMSAKAVYSAVERGKKSGE